MIDGANRLQVTRHITLPLLSPVIFFNLVTGIIATLQILVQPMLLAPGILGLSPGTVPPRDNYLYAVHAYLEIFVKQLFGYGSALLTKSIDRAPTRASMSARCSRGQRLPCGEA